MPSLTLISPAKTAARKPMQFTVWRDGVLKQGRMCCLPPANRRLVCPMKHPTHLQIGRDK